MTTFITIGALGGTADKGRPKQNSYWPVKKTHRPAPATGDDVVVFIGSFAHGHFTAVGKLADANKWRDDDEWGKKRMYRLNKFKPIKPRVPLFVARGLFPGWGWCKNARIQTAVPTEHAKLFWQMLNNPAKFIKRASNPTDTPVDIDEPAKKYKSEVVRRIRDTAMIRKLRKEYGHRCQIKDCQFDHPIVEGHHVHPLGHDGPDVKSNVLILCPNHHALFDYLVPEFITQRKIVVGNETLRIRYRKGHELNGKFTEFHNWLKYNR